MAERDVIAELERLIAEERHQIDALLVNQVVHLRMEESMEAADAVEQRLYDVGYVRTVRGDWFLL